MEFLFALYQMIRIVADVVLFIVIIQMIIGLLFSFNVIDRRNEFLGAVYVSLNKVLEPVLGPIRRRMPDTGAIDFSPLVLLILLQFSVILIGAAMKSAY
ncbi:YggT family protein [Qipengyuania flava]|uniref:YggT family protein n=1 Tax=Qipengyuania flava TaxID=192812 RepID=UPI00321928B4